MADPHPGVSDEAAARFAALFAGAKGAYGTFRRSKDPNKEKGDAFTIPAEVSVKQYADHLAGRVQFGGIPIAEDSRCQWGALNVTSQELPGVRELAKVALERLDEDSPPVFFCESLGGGVHVYLFASAPVPAPIMRDALCRIGGKLGLTSAEVFPKQVRVDPKRGQTGDWIVLPYFGGRNSYLGKVPLGQFLDYAEGVKWSEEDLRALIRPSVDGAFADGPPCLQEIAHGDAGFVGAEAAVGMQAVGFYLRRKHPQEWEPRFEDMASRLCKPPMRASELGEVMKGVAKARNMEYPCAKFPLARFCNRTLCSKRPHGVEAAGNTLFVALTKVETDPPLYYLDTAQGRRLELTSDGLHSQRRMSSECMKQLDFIPPPMKDKDWRELVNYLLERRTTVEMPADSTPIGGLAEELEAFCTGPRQAVSRWELTQPRGKDKVWTEQGRHWFRSGAFVRFVQKRRNVELGKSSIYGYLHKLGVVNKFFCIPNPDKDAPEKERQKGMNLWGVSEFGTSDPWGPPPAAEVAEQLLYGDPEAATEEDIEREL